MCGGVMAQEVQWASEVIEFSTQLSEYQYAATQVLGEPDVLPDFGDNPNAWLPSRPDRTAFVKVGFERPMMVRQIAVAESFNPGALYQIFLYDDNGQEYLLNTFAPRPLDVEGGQIRHESWVYFQLGTRIDFVDGETVFKPVKEFTLLPL